MLGGRLLLFQPELILLYTAWSILVSKELEVITVTHGTRQTASQSASLKGCADLNAWRRCCSNRRSASPVPHATLASPLGIGLGLVEGPFKPLHWAVVPSAVQEAAVQQDPRYLTHLSVDS